MFQLWTIGSEQANECATQLTSFSSMLNKRFTDPRISVFSNYQSGDEVWLSTGHLLCLRQSCKKRSLCSIGPFTIQRQINDVISALTFPLIPHSPSISRGPSETLCHRCCQSWDASANHLYTKLGRFRLGTFEKFGTLIKNVTLQK